MVKYIAEFQDILVWCEWNRNKTWRIKVRWGSVWK